MSDWQPIETAPKDGTRILLYVREMNHPIGIGCWFEETTTKYGKVVRQYAEWNYTDWFRLGEKRPGPTHWMPLPEAPEIES